MQLPKTKTERIRFIVIALAIGVGGWFISHQFESLDLEELLKDVSETLGAWTYAIAGVLAFLETGAFVGLVVPGETFVILAGAVAGQGATDVFVTVAIVWFCAWAGDTTSFFIGRKLGRGFILEHGPKLRITEERFKQVEGYFDRHGGKTILVGRFIGLVRALAPFVAGSSGMEYRRFVPYSVLGTGLWAGVFTFLGYFGSQSIEEIANVAGQGVLLFGITVGRDRGDRRGGALLPRGGEPPEDGCVDGAEGAPAPARLSRTDGAAAGEVRVEAAHPWRPGVGADGDARLGRCRPVRTHHVRLGRRRRAGPHAREIRRHSTWPRICRRLGSPTSPRW